VSILYVVATPIGNLADMSPRAVQTLRDVKLIAAEDTRHSRRLLTHFEVKTPLISYHQHNQSARRSKILKALDEGDVALISDAGTPAISDPGADLVAAAHAAGHRVSPVPGPSALAAAVSASGLIEGPFVSLGFLPRREAERIRLIARTAAIGMPVVLFESANRAAATLSDLADGFGDRSAVVLRELSKLHEEVRAGTLLTLREWASEVQLLGELVIVVAGSHQTLESEKEVIEVLHILRKAGLSASQAAREAAVITGRPRSELYELARRTDESRSIGLEGQLTLPDEDTLQYAFGDEEAPKRGQS
jgi:16S rRNA (cytidine1402-2'-O)-methyltransferase